MACRLTDWRRIGSLMIALVAVVSGSTSCGGGGGGGDAGGDGMSPIPPSDALPALRVSADTPFTANCNGAAQTGTLYRNAEVEPFLVVNPTSPANLIAIWQQDRWSNGAAQGLVAAASFDDGESWSRTALPFSVCGGGTAANGGDFARASDPWLAGSPDGTLHALGLAVTGAAEPANAASAMLVARSIDGGLTWSDPIALIREPGPAMNDKGSLTADPADGRFVYAVWDRLTEDDRGPAWFARTVNGGMSWEAPRGIYDPGSGSQTIGNVIVVLAGDELVNVFTQIDGLASGRATARLRSLRSSDRGDTWSGPTTIADLLAIGASDPDTGKPIRDGAILASAAVDPVGAIHVVWQDARFSNGARDGIAYTSSSDGGITWSPPVPINGDLTVQAFLPTIHIRNDGVIGVTYFDLRSNTPSPASLPTDYWLATSVDGVTWAETRVAAAFDLATAPDAGGLFLGDYMGIASVDREFLLLYATTAGGTATNRTELFLTSIEPAEAAATSRFESTAAAESMAAKPVTSNDWRQRMDRRLRWMLELRFAYFHPASD